MWTRVNDFYEVSDAGEVRSRGGWRKFGARERYCVPHVLKPAVHSRGYLVVSLRVPGDRRTHKAYVHRLVAAAFLPAVEGAEVNHRNGDKKDNRAENLEWITRSENARHKVCVLGSGLGESHSGAVLSWAKVQEIRLRRRRGETLKGIAEQYGVTFQNVHLICAGKSWTGPRHQIEHG